VRAARYGDHELVVWRTASGRLGVARAYCPHLGAHLGHEGRVRGDLLECGFHGFCFDARGDCRRTGYGKHVPSRAKLATFHTTEMAGAVLAWFPPAGPGAPEWPGSALPAFELTTLAWEGWSPVRWATCEVAGHPMETTENSVDVGHFAFLHGYREVSTATAARCDGPVLRASYKMTRHGRGLSGLLPAVRTDFDVVVEGLGVSRVDLTVRSLGAMLRLFVLPTPVGPGRVRLMLGASARAGLLAGAPAALRLLPGGLLARTVRDFTLFSLRSDVSQDRAVWATKRHLPRPVLAEGDGPIALYRRWAAQFLTH
jgi:nitrite reductase/ring-hydroxylating ferredoxin subunit